MAVQGGGVDNGSRLGVKRFLGNTTPPDGITPVPVKTALIPRTRHYGLDSEPHGSSLDRRLQITIGGLAALMVCAGAGYAYIAINTIGN